MTGRWWQRGTGGGARGLGGLVGANSGEHRVEERGHGAMEGEGASNSETGVDEGHAFGELDGETRCTTEVENGQRHGRRGALVGPCYVWSHFYHSITLYG